jgi:HAD superfamily hydrolase (TIGR01549 family)
MNAKARPDKEYTAWLVDLDGTLYWAPGVKLAMALELVLFGWGAARRLRRFRHEHEALRADPAAPEGDPFMLQLDRAARALHVDRDKLERDVRSWMIARPSRYLRWFRRSALLAEIREFKANGGRTGLVSDYPAREKLGALGARELFEVVVASGESPWPRRLKPDPDGYLRAAQALGVPPANCLVIGDRRDADGEAARKAGMGFRKIG